MIGYADLDDLDDERSQRVQELFERSSTIWDLPDDLDKIRVWDEFIADCERVGFPHLIASSRMGQYSTLSQGGLATEALEAYVKLMQVIRRHGDLIAAPNVAVMLGSIATVSMTMAEDPAVPLERIGAVTDLVEQEMRRRGVDTVGAQVARAVVAAAAGDGEATMARIERARAAGSDHWRPNAPGDIQIEIPLVARFDLELATRSLEQRLRLLEIDPAVVDLERGEPDTTLRLLTMLAFLHLRVGRRDEAYALADRLVEAAGIDELARETVGEYLLPVLEHRPEQAVVAVDWALANLELDDNDWELTAAVARSRILADPDGDEGWLLRALAEQSARAHDRRGDTDLHTRDLESFWWADLPRGPRPALIDDEAIWGDREERAERILASGWLARTGMVSMDDPPIATKDRYVALLGESMTLLSVGSDAEADELAARLSTRAEELHCATSRYCVPLLHGLRAGQHGDVVTLVDGYSRAQAEMVANAAWITESIQAIGEKVFTVTVEQAVASPAVAWERIEDLVATETRMRQVTGGPETHVILAHAELAAHHDDRDRLRLLLERLETTLSEEADRLDPVDVDLEMVRLTALIAPALAAAKARRIAEVGDAEQSRTAVAWLCWFASQAGQPEASGRLAGMLADAEGDVESFGVLPGWVLLEGLAGADIDLDPVIDALLAEAGAGSGDGLELYAAAGSLLLARAPDDPRGPALREKAVGMAGGLDRRNGTTVQSSRVRDRWFPGDPDFGALS